MFDPTRLHKLADFLLVAAEKTRELSDAMLWDSQKARAEALGKETEAIANKFKVIADEIRRIQSDGGPVG